MMHQDEFSDFESNNEKLGFVKLSEVKPGQLFHYDGFGYKKMLAHPNGGQEITTNRVYVFSMDAYVKVFEVQDYE